jgi:predicted KAP-like P-loop ATPase
MLEYFAERDRSTVSRVVTEQLEDVARYTVSTGMKRYQSDRAARDRQADQLGRVPFAEQLADAFVGWREDESLVVSLTGPWGSGKTSIKNFVVDSLGSAGAPRRADVIEFSPWELSGSGDVERHFFGRIGAFLGRKDAAKADRQIAKKWTQWTAAMWIPEAMVNPLTKYLSAPAIMIGLSSVLSGTALGRIPWIVGGTIIALLGVSFSVSSTVGDRVAQFFTARADASDVAASELKRELADLLRLRERPLVVIIDDVDRLTSTEIRLLFRLIKANADLPRMLYFLLFDKKAVIRAMEREGFESGEQYLEKIVQAPFAIPAIQAVMLNDVLIVRLNDMLRQLPETEQVEERRWMELYFRRLHRYFQTLRDVYRFLAALEFHSSVFHHENSFEVNFVDLFVLETLRMFEPVVYERLSSQKRLLVIGSLGLGGSNTDAEKKALEDLLAGARQPDVVRAALSEIFPRAAWAWGGSSYGEGFESGWTKAKRVGTDTHFDKYFYLAVPKGGITQSELDGIVRDSAQREVLRTYFKRFKNEGRIEQLLLRLEYEKDRIPTENAMPFVTALFDEGDDLPPRTDMWGMDAEMHLTRIIYWYLVRLGTIEKREHALRISIASTEALYGPSQIVSLEEPNDRQRPDREAIIPPTSLPEFHQLCVAKIAAAANTEAFLRHPHMLTLLYRWREWTDGNAVRAWAQSKIANPESAMALLAGFVQVMKRSGMGSVVTEQIPIMRLKEIEDFVDVDALDRILPAGDTQEGDRRQAITLFRKGVDRRRKGLPELDRLTLDHEDE